MEELGLKYKKELSKKKLTKKFIVLSIWILIWILFSWMVFDLSILSLWDYWILLNDYLVVFIQNFIILAISFSSAIVVLFGFRVLKKFI